MTTLSCTLALAALAWAQHDNGVRVTFTLHAPLLPDTATVFITGSITPLGMWDPGRVAMERRGHHAWTKSVVIPKPGVIEYKYTLGSWAREGADSAGAPLRNFEVNAVRDTLVVDSVVRWRTRVEPRVVSGKITGTVRYHKGMNAPGVLARDLVVWLPPGYEKEADRRYTVVYMQDGQNLFDPATSAFGVDWGIDESADSLIRAGALPPVIVVGIYNSAARSKEYLPGKEGSAYMRFMAEVVRPFIDSTYRTLPGPGNSIVGGSSSGATIAFMLVLDYPGLFSKAICMSPAFMNPEPGPGSWTCIDSLLARPREDVFFYIDNGGAGIDLILQPGVEKMLEALRSRGYVEGKDFVFVRDMRGKHFESDWGRRFPAALETVLRK